MKNEPRYFSPKQFNKIAYQTGKVIARYTKYMKLVDKAFRSQIMLAVSEVNGCKGCSYVHTNAVIKSGATEEELQLLLDGTFEKFPEDKALALVFAQHYADTLGDYDKEAFDKIIDYYGLDIATGIMATIKVIMFGNTNGIAIGNLKDRLCFKKVPNAKFLTDLHNTFMGYFLLPLFIIANLFSKKPLFN